MITCQSGQSLTICTRCYQSIGVKITVLTKEDVLYEGVISVSLSCLNYWAQWRLGTRT